MPNYEQQYAVAKKLGFKSPSYAMDAYGKNKFIELVNNHITKTKGLKNKTTTTHSLQAAKNIEGSNYLILPNGEVFFSDKQKSVAGASIQAFGVVDTRYCINGKYYLKSILIAFYFTEHGYSDYDEFVLQQKIKIQKSRIKKKLTKTDAAILRLNNLQYPVEQIAEYMGLQLNEVKQIIIQHT